MNGRSRDEVPGVVKLGLGVGVGFALYKLLGWAGGLGRGAGAPGTTGPALPPARPRDPQPVEVLVQPSPVDRTKAVIEMIEDARPTGKIATVRELIARIDAGGRRDVRVMVTGDTRHGAWKEIREALEFAGIQIWLRQP